MGSVAVVTTRVELSIEGRGANGAPLLVDLVGQLQDFFDMVSGVAASMRGDDVERFEWQVVGLSKNSPARVIVEAISTPGHDDGPELAAHARDIVAVGLDALRIGTTRPEHFTGNVIEAADRFARRAAYQLASTTVGDGRESLVVLQSVDAAQVAGNIGQARESDPVRAYVEIGSLEGTIQSVGSDAWQKPFVIVRSRLNGDLVKCYLTGEARSALEAQPVASVVWQNRRVSALGTLYYRSAGKISRSEVSRLDFFDPDDPLPQLVDIIDRGFTSGLGSEDYLERLRNGEA